MERNGKSAGGRTPSSAEDIRALRGALSRADFAAQVGVTPLTVYRWELPEGAAEARRPRGKVAARLAALADRAQPPVPPASSTPSLEPAEQTALLPLIERLSSGDLRRVESELLVLMASGSLRTLASRAMSAQAIARIALLARADTAGAFATLMPLLPELPRLPAPVQLELQVTAALLFTWPDGRFLEPGRANAYLTGAERLLPDIGTPETRALLRIAQYTLALIQEAPERVTEALSRATALSEGLDSPVIETLVLEAQAQAAAQSGRFAVAARDFERLLDVGALTVSRVRALGHLAEASLQGGRPPGEALGLVERARELARKDRLQPGLHGIAVEDIAGAALHRLGRFEEATRTLDDAIELAAEVGWTPAWPAMTLAQVHLCAGRAEELRALGERLQGYSGPISTSTTHALGALLPIVADLVALPDEPTRLVAELDRRIEAFEREVGWKNLRAQVLLTTAMVTARAGTPQQAWRALRRAEQHLEGAPSVWVGALVRRSRGLVLAREGQLDEARRQIESALGTLTLAEDVANSAHARLMLAQLAAARGEAGAKEQQARDRAELRALGYAFGLDDLEALRPAGRARRDPGTPAAPGAAHGPDDQLAVSIQRLATRGLSLSLIHRELVAVAAELMGGPRADAMSCLEELDSAGRSSPVARSGRDGLPPQEWVELSDGAGRRLRLGVGGTAGVPGLRGRLAALAVVAEMAFELASLRGVAGGPAAAPLQPAGGDDLPDVPGFIGVSASMRQLKADLVRLSRSRATVIVTGESGSGKEVVARAIHELSSRAAKPYVAFNCAAVPRELFEGLLFGSRKGAFTGATADQPGVLRSADGGTVLLDEIGELPLDVQPKLLRFLENGEVLPLGERRPLKLDVRVIAATFRDLEQLVRERLFREDLFYRLQVVALRVPPLRERPEDLVALARHFLRQLSPPGHEPPILAPDAIRALHAHRWPGNVRELRNVIERSLAFEPLPAVFGPEHLRISA